MRKLTALKNVVTSNVGRRFLIVQKNSPGILFSAGVVGVVAAAVLASRATLKLDAVLEEHEKTSFDINTMALQANTDKYSEEDAHKDRVLLMVKTGLKITRLYGPAIVIGIASIAALTGSHITLNRRLAGVTAAYAALDKGFDQYRKRVVKELGEEKDREFRYGLVDKDIVEETPEGPVTKTIKAIDKKNEPSIYARFFDQTSSSWNKIPAYNRLFIQCQQNYANDLLRSRGHVFLNDVYDMLGLQRSKAGAIVGWLNDSDGDGFIDFGVFSHDEWMGQQFVNGNEDAVLLDFNVDGPIWDKI